MLQIFLILKTKYFFINLLTNIVLQACKNYNANISFTVAEKAFDEVKEAEKQGYKFVHPFDGAAYSPRFCYSWIGDY